MGVYDKAELFQQVLRILPNVQAIGVTGSAAFEGEHFRKDSDIDVVALNPTSCYAWGELSGHTLEIHAYDIERMKKAIRNPQWHGPNWIWNIGKIGGAEHLFGRSLENIVRRQITSSTRLVAGAALIGYLLLAASKERTGRRRASVDVPLILTALRRVVSGTFPIRALADDDLAAFSLTSDFLRNLRTRRYSLKKPVMCCVVMNDSRESLTFRNIERDCAGFADRWASTWKCRISVALCSTLLVHMSA